MLEPPELYSSAQYGEFQAVYEQDVVLMVDLVSPASVRRGSDLLRYKLLFHGGPEPEEGLQAGGPAAQMWAWTDHLYWALVHPIFFTIASASLLQPTQQHHLLQVAHGDACPVGAPARPRTNGTYYDLLASIEREGGFVVQLSGALGEMSSSLEVLGAVNASSPCPTRAKESWSEFKSGELALVLIMPAALSALVAALLGWGAYAAWRAEVLRRSERVKQRLSQLHRFGSVPVGNGDYLVYLPRVKDHWGGLNKSRARRGSVTVGAEAAGVDYCYFIMDSYCNFAGLHSVMHGSAEGSLGDLYRALIGDTFLMHPLDPAVEELVRKMHLHKNTFSQEHYYSAVLLQRMYRQWQSRKRMAERKNQAELSIKQAQASAAPGDAAASSAGAPPEDEGPDKPKLSPREKLNVLSPRRKRRASVLAGPAGLKKDDQLPLNTQQYLLNMFISPLDIIQSFMETVLNVTSLVPLRLMDDVRKHVVFVHKAVADISNLATSTYIDKRGNLINPAFLRGAAQSSRKMLLEMSSEQEQEKAMRYLTVEVARVVPFLVDSRLREDAEAAGRQFEPSRLKSRDMAEVMDDLWVAVDRKRGLRRGLRGLWWRLNKTVGDWRSQQAICTCLQLSLVLVLVPAALYPMLAALAVRQKGAADWEGAGDDSAWAVPFAVLVAYLVVTVIDFWHLQVMPGRMTKLLWVMRKTFIYFTMVLVALLWWSLVMIVLWIAISSVVRPEEAAPAVVLAIGALWILYEKRVRTQNMGKALEQSVREQVYAVLAIGVDFQPIEARPHASTAHQVPRAMKLIVDKEAHQLGAKMWASGTQSLAARYVALEIFTAKLTNLFCAKTLPEMEAVAEELRAAVVEHSPNNAVTQTLLLQMVDRQVAAVDKMHKNLDHAVRKRAEQRYDAYLENFQSNGWMGPVEADVLSKVGYTASRKLTRVTMALLLFLLSSIFLCLAVHLLAVPSLATSLILSVVIAFLAWLQNRVDAERERLWGVRLTDRLPAAVARVMDDEKSSVTGMEALLGEILPPSMLKQTPPPKNGVAYGAADFVFAGRGSKKQPVAIADISAGSSSSKDLAGFQELVDASFMELKAALYDLASAQGDMRAEQTSLLAAAAASAATAVQQSTEAMAKMLSVQQQQFEASLERQKERIEALLGEMEGHVRAELRGPDTELAVAGPLDARIEAVVIKQTGLLSEGLHESRALLDKIREELDRQWKLLDEVGKEVLPAPDGIENLLGPTIGEEVADERKKQAEETWARLQRRIGKMHTEVKKRVTGAKTRWEKTGKLAGVLGLSGILSLSRSSTPQPTPQQGAPPGDWEDELAAEGEGQPPPETPTTPGPPEPPVSPGIGLPARAGEEPKGEAEAGSHVPLPKEAVGVCTAVAMLLLAREMHRDYEANPPVPEPAPEPAAEERLAPALPEEEAAAKQGEEPPEVQKEATAEEKPAEEIAPPAAEAEQEGAPAAEADVAAAGAGEVPGEEAAAPAEAAEEGSAAAEGEESSAAGARLGAAEEEGSRAHPKEEETPSTRPRIRVVTPEEEAALAEEAGRGKGILEGTGVETGAIGEMLDHHYTALAATIKPAVLGAGDRARYTPALKAMHDKLRESAKEVTDALGWLSQDEKDQHSMQLMTDLVAAMAQAQASIELVVASTSDIQSIEADIKNLIDQQKISLEGFMAGMETSIAALKEDGKEQGKEQQAALEALLGKQQSEVMEKLGPVQASLDALARVPELADTILAGVKGLGEDLGGKLDGVHDKLGDAAKTADVHSEALQAALKSVEEVGAAVKAAAMGADGAVHSTQEYVEKAADRTIGAISEKMVQLQVRTEEQGVQLDNKMRNVISATTVVQTALMDVDNMVRRMETQMRSDAPMLQTMHDRVVAVRGEQQRLMQMFVVLKKRIERGDPLHLSTQMDEIRDDVNMMMRTLGMKIHAAPLQKFKETMRDMRRSGALGDLDRGITRADVDSLLSKYANKAGVIEPEGVQSLLEDMSTHEYIARPADHMHWNVDPLAPVDPAVRKSHHPPVQKPRKMKMPSAQPRPTSAPSIRSSSSLSPSKATPTNGVPDSISARSVSEAGSSPYHADPYNVHNMPAQGTASLLNPVVQGTGPALPAWKDPDAHLPLSEKEKQQRDSRLSEIARQREGGDDEVLYGSIIPDAQIDEELAAVNGGL